MRTFKALALAVALASTAGCSGTLYQVEEGADGQEVKKRGVTAYPVAVFVDKFQTTTLVKDDKLIATIDGDPACRPVPTSKLAYGPDLERPYRLMYEPGFLETNKFSVTLTDSGTLSEVNTESTPDRGETLSKLADIATSVLPTFGVGSPVETAATVVLACNSGTQWVGRTKL